MEASLPAMRAVGVKKPAKNGLFRGQGWVLIDILGDYWQT